MAIADETARHLLRAMYDAAIVASQPAAMIHRHVPPPPAGRCVVVGAGKASAAMATALDAALLAQWGPGVAVSGVVATRHGHAAGLPAGRIAVVEAGHPVPDRHSLAAAQQIVAALHGLTAQDLVIALVSGAVRPAWNGRLTAWTWLTCSALPARCWNPAPALLKSTRCGAIFPG
jgi:hydroxypyruvate reductase